MRWFSVEKRLALRCSIPAFFIGKTTVCGGLGTHQITLGIRVLLLALLDSGSWSKAKAFYGLASTVTALKTASWRSAKSEGS
ncbi:MAG TPA: hypothetical protein VKD89_03240, partial [Candidatus Udaeobacter sp.]|nr:hypothetical protein [Candidatus Udaeobacter sp.]